MYRNWYRGQYYSMEKRILIEDLSVDDAVTLSCFRKVHLQEVANQLWPRLQCYLSGHKGAVKVKNGK